MATNSTPDRDVIRDILLSAGVDDTKPTIDGKTELQWMTDSCPSIAHALAEVQFRKERR